MTSSSSLYGSTPQTGTVASSNYTTLYSGGNNPPPNGNLVVPGTLTINGCAILTNCNSFSLLPTTAESILFGGAATSMFIGSGSGTTTINNQLATAYYTFPVADGLANQTLVTDGAGTISWAASSSVGKTYDIDATATAGGANLNLNSNLPTTDSVKFAGVGGTTVTQTDANTITISSVASLGGDVVGPSSSTDNALVRFDGTTGKLIQNSTAILDDIGNLTLAGDLAVNDGDITTTATTGNLFNTTATTVNAFGAALTTNIGAAGGPAGTAIPGQVNFAGNTFAANNYVKGAIRNSTVATNGDVWAALSGAGAGFRGISIDNSIDTNKRPAGVFRSYGAGLSGGNPFSLLHFENARGSAATPSNVNNGNSLAQINVGGYTSTGWINDVSPSGQPAAILRFSAAEAWSNGYNNVGNRFQVFTMPSALPMTSAGPKLLINGNQDALVLSSNSISLNGFSNSNKDSNVSITPGNILGANPGDRITQMGLFHYKKPGTTEYPVSSFNNFTYDPGTANYEATMNNQILGSLWFAGNSSNTSTQNSILTGLVTATATEDWTGSAAGTKVTFDATAIGSTTPQQVIGASPDFANISSDVITLEDSFGSDYLILNSTKAEFTKPIQLTGSISGSSTFAAPATGSTLSYVLPGSAGAASSVLTNDGAGNLSWTAPGGGSTFGNITVGVVTSNTISTTTGDLVLASATNLIDANSAEIQASLFTVDGRSSIDTTTITTTSTATVQLIVTGRNVMSGLVNIIQGSNVHCVNYTALRNGATAMLTTYGEMYNTTPLATFSADISGGSIRLLVTPTSATSTVFSAVRTSLT